MAGHCFNYAVWFLHSLGAVCWLCAVLLHEAEEHWIQRLVEGWWIRMSGAQSAHLSRTFTQAVARITEIVFDRVFGKELISFRLAGVSIHFSIASFFLFAILAPIIARSHAALPRTAVLGLFAFAVGGLTPAVLGEGVPVRYWVVGPFVVLLFPAGSFLILLGRLRGWGFVARGVGYVLLCLGVSLLFDLAYIAITQWVLRSISSKNHTYEIPLLVVGNVGVLVMLVVATVQMGSRIFSYAPWPGDALRVFFILNTLNFLVGSAALLLATLLLLYQFVWPLLERALYGVQRFVPIIKEKKILWIAGGVLISVPTIPTIGWARAILQKFCP